MRLVTITSTVLMLAVLALRASAQEFGFAVYNADRLYDTLPSPFYDDSDYTPEGRLAWNTERYRRKVAQTAAVLDSMAMPVVALCGVENETVVRDIVSMCGCDYSYVHRTIDSFDGMDFALLYFGDLLFPSRVEKGMRHLTVEATVMGHKFAFIICNRARNLDDIVAELRAETPDIHIVVAGDLRDTEFGRLGFSDATERAAKSGAGNALFRSGWVMADRFAVDGSLRAEGVVYGRRWMLDRDGAPAATYEGTRYRGGAGRRLPVCGAIKIGFFHFE